MPRFSFQPKGVNGITVIQENSYYAFGLVMPNSPIAMPSLPNKRLYNGGSEWQNDYANLPDYYQTYYRNYDAALGRFVSPDPLADASHSMTPYQYSNNNPISFNDPLGNAPGGVRDDGDGDGETYQNGEEDGGGGDSPTGNTGGTVGDGSGSIGIVYYFFKIYSSGNSAWGVSAGGSSGQVQSATVTCGDCQIMGVNPLTGLYISQTSDQSADEDQQWQDLTKDKLTIFFRRSGLTGEDSPNEIVDPDQGSNTNNGGAYTCQRSY